MKGRKSLARIGRRRAIYDARGLTPEDGFKRPGSMKKPAPNGRRT